MPFSSVVRPIFIGTLPDATPNSFTFTDQTDVAVSTVITSDPVTIAGINVPAPVSVSGGSYDIANSGTFVTTPGYVTVGQAIRSRHTSSASNSTATNTTVTIGGVSDTFTSTTIASGGSIDDEPAIPGGAIWVDDALGNDGNPGTSVSPKKTIVAGVALLSATGGGVVVCRDGTYTAQFSNSSMKAVTSGGWTNPNVIRAENPGGAIITGGFDISGTTNWYNEIRGFKFDDGSQKTIEGRQMKLFKVSFCRGTTSGNSSSLTIGTNNQAIGADGILLEDCWVYGPGGRYNILVFNSQNIILRRCVTRFDGGFVNGSNPPEASITQYDSANVSCQNCIAIDGLGPRPNFVADFYNAANGTGSISNNVKTWFGCMAINHIGYLLGSEGSANITNMQAVDCVSYGGSYGVSQLKGTSTLYDRITVIGSAADGFGIFGGSVTIRNCVIADNSGSALNSTSGTSCAGNGNGSNTGITVLNPYTSGLLYLPRIEASSTLKTGGTSGGQRGAEVQYRMGKSGTLWGETDWNTLQTDLMWPWPNETRLRSEMRAVTGMSTVNSERGFCATGSTFTKYIWEQLGNTSPY